MTLEKIVKLIGYTVIFVYMVKEYINTKRFLEDMDRIKSELKKKEKRVCPRCKSEEFELLKSNVVSDTVFCIKCNGKLIFNN